MKKKEIMDVICVQIGERASGKTELINSRLRRKDRLKKALIIDPNEEYTKYKTTTIEEFQNLGNCIRRISFLGLSFEEGRLLYLNVLKKVTNAFIFAESMDIYLSEDGRNFREAFLLNRTKGVTLTLNFRSLNDMRSLLNPAQLLYIDYFYCHRIHFTYKAFSSVVKILDEKLVKAFMKAFGEIDSYPETIRCIVLDARNPIRRAIIKRPKPKGEQPHKILSVSKIAKL